MIPTPTLHLRFVERQVIDYENCSHEHIGHKTVNILQQFWAHPEGEEAYGDMFNVVPGTWRDIPKVKE